MELYEYIRCLVDEVFDANPDYTYTTEDLSYKILEMKGEQFSGQQVYRSIKDLTYGNHEYTRDCNSKPYFYEKM